MIFAAEKLTAGLDVSRVVFYSILKSEQYADGCSYSLREGFVKFTIQGPSTYIFHFFYHHTTRSIAVEKLDMSFLLPRAEQGARIMDNPSPSDKCQRRRELAEDEQAEYERLISDHGNQAACRADSPRTQKTQATSQDHVAASQPQAYSNDATHDKEALVRDLRGERRATHLETHREQGVNTDPSRVPVPEYRDDRDGTIIHFGVIGTHEGKTVIPKRSVHRNALDDLAHSYDEEGDLYVLDVNLDGDQIDHLLHYSEVYNAGGVYTNFLPKIADCLLPHP